MLDILEEQQQSNVFSSSDDVSDWGIWKTVKQRWFVLFCNSNQMYSHQSSCDDVSDWEIWKKVKQGGLKILLNFLCLDYDSELTNLCICLEYNFRMSCF